MENQQREIRIAHTSEEYSEERAKIFWRCGPDHEQAKFSSPETWVWRYDDERTEWWDICTDRYQIAMLEEIERLTNLQGATS